MNSKIEQEYDDRIRSLENEVNRLLAELEVEKAEYAIQERAIERLRADAERLMWVMQDVSNWRPTRWAIDAARRERKWVTW